MSRGTMYSLSASVRKGFVLFWTALLLATLLSQYVAITSPTVIKANSSGNATLGGFQIDGRFYSSAAGDDWAQGPAGHGLVNGWTAQDPVGTADCTVFSTGAKDSNSVTGWGHKCNADPKSDIGNVYVASRPWVVNGTLHEFVYVGIERQSPSGTVQYDLEFNKQGNTTNTAGTEVPNRLPGDLLFTATQQGNGAWTILGQIQTWSGPWDTGSWSAASSISQNLFYGLANDAAASHPATPSWSDALGSTVPTNQFAEMAFDLTGINPAAVTCPGSEAVLNLRSISSSGSTPELKDYVQQIPVDINNCGTLSWQKQDDSGDALGGATFTVTPNPATGTGSITVTDNQQPDQNPAAGVFELTHVKPGTYTIQEKTAPAGFLVDPNPQTITVAAYQDASLTTPFVDPAFSSPTLTTALTNGTTSGKTSSLTLNLDNTGTTASFTDTATFGSTNSHHLPTGSLTYSVYANNACSGTPVATSTKTISNGTVPTSDTFTVTGVGTWYVVASYAGDTYNAAASSGCADEAVTVVQPNIVASKTVDKTQANPGDTLTYTITIQNTGDGKASGVTLADDISPVLAHATYNSDVAATSGTAGYSAPNITWSGDLAAGATAKVTFSVTLNSVFPAGKTNLPNTAVVTGRGSNCTASSTDPACSTLTQVPASPILTAEKTVKVDGSAQTFSHSNSANPGDTLDYQVVVTNTGNADATNQTVSDTLAAALVANGSFVGCGPSNCSYNASTHTISWTGLNIDALGGVATLTFQVKLNTVFPAGTTQLLNTVVLEGSNCGTGSSDAKCSTTTTVQAAPILTAEKTVKVDGSANAYSHSTAANPGDTLDYQVVVTNTGNSDATNLTVTDTLASALVANSAAFDTSTCSPACSYNAATHTISWTGLNISAISGSVTLTFQVKLNSVFPAGTTQLPNTVVMANSNCAAASTDPACDTTTTVQAAPILTAEKTVKVDGSAQTFSHSNSANPGDTLDYQVVVTNTGNADATNQTVSDTLAAALVANGSFVGCGPSNCSYDSGTHTITWTSVTVAAGGSATLTFQVTLNSVFPAGTTQLPNTVVMANSNCAADSSDATCSTNTTVNAAPILGYQKLVSTSVDGPFVAQNTAQPGATLYFAITVTNTGNANALDQTIQDVMSQTLVDNSAAFNTASCNVTCTYDAGTRTITWTHQNINVGTPLVLTFNVILNSVFPAGQTTLNNSVVCPPLGDTPNPACTTTTIVTANPILTLTKLVAVGDTTPSHATTAGVGATVTYSLTVANTGNANATNETVTDDLSAVLAHATYNAGSASASSGTADFSSPNLTWSGISIAAGGTATLTFTVTLASDGWIAGTTTLPNTALEANSTDCASAQSAGTACSASVSVTTGTDLGITKAVNPTVIPGGVNSPVAYTIVVSNSGTGTTTGHVLVTDKDFPAFYSISGVQCSITISTCDATDLVGGGIDLGVMTAGEKVTITVSGTASPNNTTDIGDHVNTAFACQQVVEGQPICVSAPATLTVTLTHLPGINIVKTPSATVTPIGGGPITYTYTVTNTGNVPLSNVTVTDNKCSSVSYVSGDANSNKLLDLTETWIFTCTSTLTQTTTNVATAVGHDGDTAVSATDNATVVVPIPEVTPTPTPTPTPTATPTPKITLPPTSTLDTNAPSSQAGSGLLLVLAAVGFVMLLLGLLAPAPARARRRTRKS